MGKEDIHGGHAVDSKCLYSWLNGCFCLHQVADIELNNMTPDEVEKRDKDFISSKIKEYFEK